MVNRIVYKIGVRRWAFSGARYTPSAISTLIGGVIPFETFVPFPAPDPENFLSFATIFDGACEAIGGAEPVEGARATDALASAAGASEGPMASWAEWLFALTGMNLCATGDDKDGVDVLGPALGSALSSGI